MMEGIQIEWLMEDERETQCLESRVGKGMVEGGDVK